MLDLNPARMSYTDRGEGAVSRERPKRNHRAPSMTVGARVTTMTGVVGRIVAVRRPKFRKRYVVRAEGFGARGVFARDEIEAIADGPQPVLGNGGFTKRSGVRS